MERENYPQQTFPCPCSLLCSDKVRPKERRGAFERVRLRSAAPPSVNLTLSRGLAWPLWHHTSYINKQQNMSFSGHTSSPSPFPLSTSVPIQTFATVAEARSRPSCTNAPNLPHRTTMF